MKLTRSSTLLTALVISLAVSIPRAFALPTLTSPPNVFAELCERLMKVGTSTSQTLHFLAQQNGESLLRLEEQFREALNKSRPNLNPTEIADVVYLGELLAGTERRYVFLTFFTDDRHSVVDISRQVLEQNVPAEMRDSFVHHSQNDANLPLVKDFESAVYRAVRKAVAGSKAAHRTDPLAHKIQMLLQAENFTVGDVADFSWVESTKTKPQIHTFRLQQSRGVIFHIKIVE
jgi:hypothetical protein